MPPRAEQLQILSPATSSRQGFRQTCRSRRAVHQADPARVERLVLAELVNPTAAGELAERTGLGALFLADELERLERRGLIRNRRGVWERIRG